MHQGAGVELFCTIHCMRQTYGIIMHWKLLYMTQISTVYNLQLRVQIHVEHAMGQWWGWQQHGCQQACGTYTGDVYWQTNVQTNLIIYLIQHYAVLILRSNLVHCLYFFFYHKQITRI